MAHPSLSMVKFNFLRKDVMFSLRFTTLFWHLNSFFLLICKMNIVTSFHISCLDGYITKCRVIKLFPYIRHWGGQTVCNEWIHKNSRGLKSTLEAGKNGTSSSLISSCCMRIPWNRIPFDESFNAKIINYAKNTQVGTLHAMWLHQCTLAGLCHKFSLSLLPHFAFLHLGPCGKAMNKDGVV